MNSGPETGFGEINLPAVQPGSSVMPGKVNPVIPEYVIQICFKTMGYHTACEAAIDHGELDLNIWESVVVCSILQSMECMQDGAGTLGTRCIHGMTVDVERNQRNARTIIPLLTKFMQQHGFTRINDLCKQAAGDRQRLRELLAEFLRGANE